jgi:hypothetical protein
MGVRSEEVSENKVLRGIDGSERGRGIVGVKRELHNLYMGSPFYILCQKLLGQDGRNL